MKHLVTLLFVFFLSEGVSGQAGTWTWIKGDSAANPPAVYGTQGIDAPANTPPAAYEAAEWTDTAGNFWLFGGSDGFSSVHNNLWKYNSTTNNWTWVKGPGVMDDAGSYGVQGIPALSNNPPSRGYGVATWTDLNGDLWLYGGYQMPVYYSDLWRYNIASNMWTWISGAQGNGGQPVHGTLGVPSANNQPGRRCETDATWIDRNNDLWMFGGLVGSSYYDDLWRYNIATNMWTWMKGSNTSGQTGIYGTKGIANPANTPGARSVYCTWTDTSGNFWLFGGVYNGGNKFNDLWRYEPASNNWIWISGPSLFNNTASYGSFCTDSIDYIPAARYENRARWMDGCGNLWLYAGAYYSDLWSFNPSTLAWSFVNGSATSSVAPVFGTKGIAAPSNTPGMRQGAISWKSNNGNLFLFGGNISRPYNDVWKFVIDTACIGSCTNSCNLASPTLNANKTIFCSGDSAQICAANNFATYLWNTGETSSCIKAQLAGNYYLTVTDNSGCTAESNRVAITVYPLPPVAISINGDTLSVFDAVTQQWYLNGSAINNATSNTYIATQGGSYTVAVTDSNGCVAVSSPVVITGIDNISAEDVVSIYPNPSADGGWQLTVGDNLIGGVVEVFDANGRVVFHSPLVSRHSSLKPDVAKGVYLLRISSSKCSITRKLVRL